MRRLGLIPLALGLLAITACAASVPSEPTESRPPFGTTSPGPIAPSGTPADVPAARWAAIEADLVGRDVATSPTLVSAERVRFSDGSLGCPAPGQSYTQAQIDGMRVIVEADGVRYDYRFGRGDTPRLCPTR